MNALMKYDLIKATNNLYVSIQIASIWKTNERESGLKSRTRGHSVLKVEENCNNKYVGLHDILSNAKMTLGREIMNEKGFHNLSIILLALDDD